ncbi:aspartate aminotransferase family protein [Inquilinus limosus]|uniref:Aspartate aminotransferase family protein n=1 Tax=Inquilinus limosus TaxID=171674 RepID=A0A211ZID3_9PROT|nr:aspartate aminotransferase family protein [Inquilinus limosus]OWJ65042.1 aspartate aminotransferase family protein [Inquilinus limosus]
MNHAGKVIEGLMRAELDRYTAANPASRRLAERAAEAFPGGVPLHWMRDWATPFPLFMAEARGAELIDADGHHYVDFCLGDTGSMFGHSPAPVVRAVSDQIARGVTAMLPTEDGVAAAEALARRFGLPFWQVTTTATDANRFVLRWARAITGRSKILVFNGCYHGTVDDTFVRLEDGRAVHRPGLLGQATDLTATTKVVEFNDLAGLEAALAPGDVACVITEPALTNIGMVLPEPGFHAALRDLTRRHGTLLVIDETHTISTGPGGWTREYGLEPDVFTLGKPIAGGIPCGVYGFTAEIEARMRRVEAGVPHGHSGMGTTLSANALAMRALRAMLEEVMTEAAYAGMVDRARGLAAGIEAAVARHGLAWHVTQIGARVEFHFTPTPYRSGSEAAAAMRPDLEQLVNLFLINRGILIAPFHNMMLTSPATTEAQIARFHDAFDACAAALAGHA